MIHTKAARYLLYSQFSFFGALFLCFLLAPQVITDNLGVSYYGNYERTILPYSGGLLLTSYFIIKAARKLPRSGRIFDILEEVLVILAILIVGVLLTPYSIATLFDRVHILTSSTLFLVELILAAWLVIVSPRSLTLVALLIAQILGTFISMVSLLFSVELMLTGQTITQLTFGILLIKAVDTLVKNHKHV